MRQATKNITIFMLPAMAKKTIWSFILLAFCFTAKGQFFIKVIDSVGHPVADATVKVVPIEMGKQQPEKAIGWITDESGTVNSSIGGKCFLHIEALGYIKYEGTADLKPDFTFSIILLELPAAETGPVVITGTYEPKSADLAVQKIIIIDSAKIMAMGAVNLRDVLTNQPNIRLKQDNLLGSSLTMQGIGGQNIKILVDGVPMIGRMDGNIDLSQINLNNIERIEIVEGPMSVMYGTDALGGVINLITKKNGRQGVEGNLNTYYETVGNYNIDGRVAYRTPKNITTQISMGRNFFDGFGETGIRGRVQQWKPKEQYFGDAAVGFNIKKSTHRIQGSAFSELLLDRGEPTITSTSVYAFDNYFYTRRFNTAAFSNFELKNKAKIQLINSYSWFRRSNTMKRKDLITLENTLAQGGLDTDTSVFDLWQARGTYTQKYGTKLNYQLGYDLNRESGTGERIQGNKQVIGDYALYGSLEYKPLVRLTLRPGIRASYNTKYGAPVTPSFNAKYDISKSLSLRGSYARGFRAPSIKELNLFFVDINHNIRPNANLQAEISDNANLWLLYTHSIGKESSIRIEPSFYYNDIRNMITLAVVDATTQLYSYVNVGHYSNAGTALNTTLNLKQLSVQTGATFMAVRNYITGVPSLSYTHELRGNVSYRVAKTNTQISLFYKYNGAVPGYATDDNNTIIQTYIQGYSMADASVVQSFLGKRIVVGLGSRNIFNVIRISFNAPGGAHSGNSTSMGIGTGRTFFTSIKIYLHKQEKDK